MNHKKQTCPPWRIKFKFQSQRRNRLFEAKSKECGEKRKGNKEGRIKPIIYLVIIQLIAEG